MFDAFDGVVSGFGGCVGHTGGVPVSGLGAPTPDGATEPVDLMGWVGVLELSGDLLNGCGAEFGVVDAVDASQCLVGVPGVANLAAGIASCEQPQQFHLAGLGDAFMAGYEQFAGLIQRIVLRPRWPSVWFWTLRRVSSKALLAKRTTWNGSATWRACGSAVPNAAR